MPTKGRSCSTCVFSKWLLDGDTCYLLCTELGTNSPSVSIMAGITADTPDALNLMFYQWSLVVLAIWI